MKITVAVLFGGESVEHEISCISANQALHALDQYKYQVIPIYIGKNRQLYTGDGLLDLMNYKNLDDLIKQCVQVQMIKKGNKVELHRVKPKLMTTYLCDIDVAMPIIHGTNGEDGTIQGYLEMLRIPYTGCNVIAAAAGQDKVLMKHCLQNSGIPIVPWTWFYSFDFQRDQAYWLAEVKKIGFPVVIKPANLGSSVGISIAEDELTLIKAVEEAKQYDQKIIVEQMVENLLEVNCSVLGNAEQHEASVVEEVAKSEEILSYKDKYQSGGKSKGMAGVSSRIIPARLDETETQLVKDLALKTFKVLGSSGVVRVDLMKNQVTGKYYVNEINTIPGSLAFYLWEPVGISYQQLLQRLITIALDNYRIKEQMIFSYDTNVLANYKGVKGTKKVG